MTETGNKLSFRKKDEIVCPVCQTVHHEEVLRQGGGRLIAGNLTDELRRLYKPSPKFGKVYPQAYTLRVCPKCYYSALPADWDKLNKEEIEKLRSTAKARQQSLQKILGPISKTDFNQDRDLELGAASYMLAVDCYNFRFPDVAPVFKKGLFSLRAAWLFTDMAEKYPKLPYKNVVNFFYKKSYSSYSIILDLFQSGKEKYESVGRFGPDIDKDFGFEGLQYLVGVLVYKFGQSEPDLQKRIQIFDRSRRILGKMFGHGRASKNLPADLIDKTRDMHEKMGDLIRGWEEELGQKPTASS